MLRMLFPVLLFSLTVAAAEDGKVPEPTEVVKKLYEDHLREKGVIAERDEHRDQWPFQFGEEMAKALASEGWGFDPLLFAQDHEVKDLKVREIERDQRGNVLVLVTFSNFGQPQRLIVALAHTDHGYRVENIMDPVSGVSVARDLVERKAGE